MTQQYAQVSVRILDKDYTIKCPPEERTDLLDSAEILNAKMREARDAAGVVGLDRIAVIAALNMAMDMLTEGLIDVRTAVMRSTSCEKSPL